MRLAESGCDLVALELSEATAGVCRERVAAAGATAAVEVVVGNAETGAGIQGREFDAVVGVSVLHHLDLDAALAAMALALVPGGRFAFSEPNMANPQIWAERHLGPVKRRRHVTDHETAFRPGELGAAFERAGLAVDVCEPFEFLHPSTPARLIGTVAALERGLERTPARAIAGSVRVAGRKVG